MFDLGPAAAEVSRLVTSVRDDQLRNPTPCAEWTVADLLEHVHQFSHVFTQNAQKEPVDPPTQLVAGWRAEIPAQLEALARAWHDDSAWTGEVSAGGIEMDAADNAVVAIEELTVHGWDLARATGQPIAVEDASLDQVDRFLSMFGGQEPGEGPFGSVVDAPVDASRLERTIAQTGRDPRWPLGG